jgi:dTDP-4-amino-4,6-dideoxygalactose transaminase
MILTDFAPNENWHDVAASFKMLIRPWLWKKGKYTTRLKLHLKKFFPGHEVYLYFSARGALYLLLQSLGLRKNAGVLIQAFTCEAVPLPVLALGLRPIYVDIERETYSMDIESLMRRADADTKVLILQHTFGLTPKYRQEILEVARKKGLIVIEDLAHGAQFDIFKKTDSQKTIKLLSFGRSKFISSVFGGAIALKGTLKQADHLKSRERNLNASSNFSIFRYLLYKPLSVLIKSTYSIFLGKVIHALTKNIIPAEVSDKEKSGAFDSYFLKTYPNALAYLAQKQLKRFDRIVDIRANSFNIYKRTFEQNGPNLLNQPVIRYPLESADREAVIKLAKSQGVLLGSWYDQVIAPKSVDLALMKYRKGSCPVAESVVTQIINLPTLISDRQIERVIKTIKAQ